MTRKRSSYRPRLVLHPLERQILRRNWSAQGVDAQIQAMAGQNVQVLLDKAGSMFWVVLWACGHARHPVDCPDRRIVRGAVNALGDISGHEEIPDLQRGAVASGLEAVKRMVICLPAESLFFGGLALKNRASVSDVTASEFPT